MLQTRNADEWTQARVVDLADEWTRARLADLADEWTLARLVDLKNRRVNLQFKNEDGSGPSCSGVNPGRVRPGPRTDLKYDETI